MIALTLLALLSLESPEAAPELTDDTQAVTTIVEKKVIYKKETTVDLTGSNVSGEGQLPPAFFVTKMQTPRARSLLEEKLRFKVRNYNLMGQ